MAEDARAAARRIVEEVLASHATEAPDDDGPADDGGTTDGTPPSSLDAGDPAAPAPTPISDPRSHPDTMAGALEVDEDAPHARAVARRIVEEVLASHADAERPVEVPESLAEAEGPPPPPQATPGQPVPGRPAIAPGSAASELTADLPAEPDPADVAEDAASIARRIVEGVIADANAEDAVEDPGLESPDEDADLVPDHGPPPHPVESVATADADGTLRLPAADEATADPDGTAALPARVATLQHRSDGSAEVTTPVPMAAPPAKASRWLIASILGAIGLAVLLPLAVNALRSLVALG